LQTIKRFMRTPEAAEYVGLSPSTLEKFRLTGEGPDFQKAGPKIVVYKPEDLDLWLEARRHRSTSDPGSTAATGVATTTAAPSDDSNASFDKPPEEVDSAVAAAVLASDAQFFIDHPNATGRTRNFVPGECPLHVPPGHRVVVRVYHVVPGLPPPRARPGRKR
jgi:hypothetical protein